MDSSRVSRVLIWGAGQHGRVVAEIARAAGYTVLGYVDADAGKLGTADAAGARVVAMEAALQDWLQGRQPMPVEIDAIVPAIGENRERLRQLHVLGDWLAPPMVHPRAYVSPSARVLAGTVVGPMAVVNTNSRVGRGVIVNTGAIVGHDTRVGDAAHVGAHVVLAGGVQVGECAFVAPGADVIPAVRVGAYAIVGAGAVVLHDVPAATTVAGVPARLLGSKHRESSSEQDISVTTAFVGS
jgi:sugar O-acyltransferase (sialic acid O-acetyltransferase NeuD family)